MERFVDARAWPLVVIRYPVEPTPADIAQIYAGWDVQLARGRHAVLVDLRLVNPLFVGPRMRKIAADAVEQRRTSFEQCLIAEARAIPNPLVRHAVTAFDWIQGLSFKRPLRNFDDFDRAHSWLSTELHHIGLLESYALT